MKSKKIRPAVFAGSWYPADPDECEREIKSFLEEGKAFSIPQRELRGGIVPHAGWYFSGSIACNVIQCLRAGEDPDVLIVYGMHLHPDSPSFLMPEGAWQTPFGEIPVEENLAGELAGRFKFQLETADNFSQDNTIELQLPFIKYFFRDVKIVALGVPPHNNSLEIARATVEIAADLGLHLKVLGSTDLTHYGYNYGMVSKGTGPEALQWVRDENDRRLIDTILSMNPEAVIEEAMHNYNACCSGAVASAMETARQMGAEKADEIVYATSYEKRPADSFVGYVGIVF